LGARLGHCLFYDPGYYLANPAELLNFRDGGLASHGAAVGLLIGLWLFSRHNKLPWLWSLDRIMVPVAIGGALVRLGNLFNHEIYGGPTDLPWGFSFIENLGAWMNEAKPVHGPFSHPTQIYEALCYLILFGILCWLYYKKDTARRHPGLMFGVALIGIFLSRFLIEFVKNPQVAFEENMAINMGQILSIPFIVAGVAMVIYGLKHKTTPPPLADRSFWPKAKPEPRKGGKKK
jgi:prolipoprotein diacylglyceryl transferase